MAQWTATAEITWLRTASSSTDDWQWPLSMQGSIHQVACYIRQQVRQAVRTRHLTKQLARRSNLLKLPRLQTPPVPNQASSLQTTLACLNHPTWNSCGLRDTLYASGIAPIHEQGRADDLLG
jgi:predicted RNA-binding Zn ribbon-like protein